MKRSSTTRLGATFTAFLGLTMLGAGCGADGYDEVQTTELPISGGWTTLNLINGWTNYNSGNTPSVGIVNGVVTFRGAIKASNPTSNVPFVLSDQNFSAFQPSPLNRLLLRTVMRTSGGSNVGGMFHFMSQDDMDGVEREVELYQDGVSPIGVGAAAKNFTSLDGVGFDRSVGEAVIVDASVWDTIYGFRESGDTGLFVKLVDGFVRFQGMLYRQNEDLDGFIGTLPASKYIPGQTVTIPVNLGYPATGGIADSWGALSIYPDGNIYVNGNPPAANEGTCFEGAWFSKTNSGNVNLPLNTSAGWHAFSARTVKVGKYGDVVRLQGAISGGNSATIATLPAGYWPAKTIRLVGAANGPVPATIVINTSGVMTVEGPPLNVSSLFLSLDGVSFGL